MDRDIVGTFWPYARLLAGLSPDASPNFRDACYHALVRHGLRRVPYIAAQLNALDPDRVRRELKEYGAWTPEELADHDANLTRLLWCACCDIGSQSNGGMTMDELIPPDVLRRLAAVARRLYSQDRMGADQMRNAAQMLQRAVEMLDPDFNLNERHATYDAWLK